MIIATRNARPRFARVCATPGASRPARIPFKMKAAKSAASATKNVSVDFKNVEPSQKVEVRERQKKMLSLTPRHAIQANRPPLTLLNRDPRLSVQTARRR